METRQFIEIVTYDLEGGMIDAKTFTNQVEAEEYANRRETTPQVGYAKAFRDTEVKCCGQWVLCRGFTSTCDRCGADYNWTGQLLAPREQWGEETGEAWWEIY